MPDPTIPAGQPTWARMRTGAGVSLPSRDDYGQLSAVSPGVPVLLEYLGVDADGLQVWTLPADRWPEGCGLELGPVPDGVRVRLDGRSTL